MKKDTTFICLIVGFSILTLLGVAFLNLNNAVAQKNLLMVDFLLKIGFDPNRKDSNGYTPLHFAAINGDEKVAHALIEAGANINALDDSGALPIESATSFGHQKVVELLIKNNATTEPSLIFSASFKGHSEIVKLLLNRGLPANKTFAGGTTALHSVSFGDHVETARLLLENGAPINALREDGFTPLHSAAFYGADRVVELLVERGADLNVIDKNGLTPLGIANRNGHKEVERILRTAKATKQTASKEEMSSQSMAPIFLKIYQKSFSLKETDGQVSIYKSNLGQAVIHKMPIVLQNTMQIMPRIQALQQEMVIQFQNTQAQ